jgi:hypothetical protein
MTSNRVPGGVALAPDESTLIVDRFMYSTVAFYLHTELALTSRRFIAARPSTLFGLIPVGTSRASYPMENIAGVNAGTRLDVIGLIVGVFALLFGLAALGVPNARGLAIPLILLGAAAIAGAPKQYVEVMNSGGGTIRFPVSVFERGRTLDFASKVSEAIARSPKGFRASSDYERPSPAPADPTGALRQLELLRSQGLITEAEFTAKRHDVLNRL